MLLASYGLGLISGWVGLIGTGLAATSVWTVLFLLGTFSRTDRTRIRALVRPKRPAEAGA